MKLFLKIIVLQTETSTKAPHKSVGESIENAFQIRQYLIPVRFSYCIKALQAGCSDKETLYFCSLGILWGIYFRCEQCVEMKGLLEEHMVAGEWVAPCRASAF